MIPRKAYTEQLTKFKYTEFIKIITGIHQFGKTSVMPVLFQT